MGKEVYFFLFLLDHMIFYLLTWQIVIADMIGHLGIVKIKLSDRSYVSDSESKNIKNFENLTISFLQGV